MSAKDSPGKRRWGKTVGMVLFWGVALSFLAYQIAQDRRLAERANPQMAEIRTIFEQAIEDGVAPAEAKWNYTIGEQQGMEYVIRYTEPNGYFDYYFVSLDWEGRWFFSGGAGGEKSFIRDRLKVE
jgi:hypothetical protein